MDKVLYLIGSLRNPRVPELAKALRKAHSDVEVFDDWFAAGPEADDWWKRYEEARGRTYREALAGHPAKHVFDFDRSHLDRATHVLLVLPAGKSGHMEITYAEYGAKLKPKTAILLDPEDVRWDVMYKFIPEVLTNDEEITDWLEQSPGRSRGETPVPPRNWVPGLLPKCTSRGGEAVESSYPTASSRSGYALGTPEVYRPPKQNHETPNRFGGL